MKFIFASNNKGKIKEINQLLSPYHIEVVPQAKEGVPEVAETGQTFIENALLKARQATRLTHLPTFADDSGLVVPSLDGEPGIFSARYAGEQGDSTQNIAKLLQKLANFPDEQRDAYFYCIIVLLRNEKDPCPIVCEGKWQGKILWTPRGHQGFGYDPIFFVPEHNCSAAELPPGIKNQISHRGQAMQKLIRKIPELQLQ